MYEVVLRHRHTVVEDNLFYLCQIYRIETAVNLQGLHERFHVIGTVSRIDILHYYLAGYWKLGIERNFRVGRMTAEASAVLEDCKNTFVLRKVFSRHAIHRPVNHKKSSCRNQCSDSACF